MVNFPSQNNIKKTKRSSIGKRESSRERRRSTQNVLHRTPSGSRIENKNVEDELMKISDKQDDKPPTSNSSMSSREPRSDSTKVTVNKRQKRASLVGKPPQSPSSKLHMARRRSMGKTTKTMKQSGKNQSVSPKSKDKKNKKKERKIVDESQDSESGQKLTLTDSLLQNIPVSEVSDVQLISTKAEPLQLASFTTTETETVKTVSSVKMDASEIILKPAVADEKINQEEKYMDNTVLVDDDMLGMTIGALGDKYRKYIPYFRAHKITVDQLLHAEFDSQDYKKLGVDENDVPAFLSHFNGSKSGYETHEISKNDTFELQTAGDTTPREFETEFEFREKSETGNTLTQETEHFTPENEEETIQPELITEYHTAPEKFDTPTISASQKQFNEVFQFAREAEATTQELLNESLDQKDGNAENNESDNDLVEKVEKLMEADKLLESETSGPAVSEKLDDNMTAENMREVILNTADKLHEIGGNVDYAAKILKSEPEQVLIQNNIENLPNDKVPIQGILDEINKIANLSQECKDLGKDLENKVDQKVEEESKEETKIAVISEVDEFLTDCEIELENQQETSLESGEIKCSDDESGVEQGNSSSHTEPTSKDTHNTSTSSTASIDDIKKYAIIFGTGALISVGMYKLLRR